MKISAESNTFSWFFTANDDPKSISYTFRVNADVGKEDPKDEDSFTYMTGQQGEVS